MTPNDKLPPIDRPAQTGMRPAAPQASSFSRAKGASRYASSVATRNRRRTIGMVVAGVILLALVVAAIVAAAGFGFYNSVGSRLTEQYDNDERLRTVLADQRQSAVEIQSNWTDTSPFYMLLLGVDSDQNRMQGDEAYLYGDDESYFRTDTIILARIDPAYKKVALVSIHRDTWVPIDGVEQKINNAYSIGGVAKTIEVVSEFAGVPITHYAQVNLDGFAAIVDSLGGLEVTIPIEINDPEYSGAHFDPGTQVLNGYEATLFARIRHAYDDLGDGDRYRAANQRQIISVLLQRIMSATPVEMINTIDAMAGYVNTDLSLDQIINLALAMRGLDVTRDVYTTMNPTRENFDGEVWYETSLEDEWSAMMYTIDTGGIPDADADIPTGLGTVDGVGAIADANDPKVATSIQVKDATGDPGRAGGVVQALRDAGWQRVADAGEANIFREEGTVVVYDDTICDESRARAVADQIGASVEEVADVWSLPPDVDLMVVIGAASAQ